MFAFRCERFPRGVVHIRTAAGTAVDFVDGYAEVDDEQTAQLLREVPDVFRIVEIGGFPVGVEIAGEPVTVTPVDDTAVPPGMSVATTLHWVGDDSARAQAALDHEHTSESPRATLINRLRAKLG